MKRIILLILVLIASLEVCFAQEVKKVNGVFYKGITDQRGKPIAWEVANQIENGGCKEEYVEFVSEIDGLPVVAFAQGAFQDNSCIKTMVLSSNLVANFYAYRSFDMEHDWWGNAPGIFNDTFANCTNLQKIILPDNLISTGTGGFYGCSNLKDVTLGSQLAYIGNVTFAECKSLHSITFPNTLKRIGISAFGEIGTIDTIVLPNGFEAFERLAFWGTSVNNLVFPENTFGVDMEYMGNTIFTNVENVYISSLEIYLSIYGLNALTKNKFNLFYDGELLTKATIPIDCKYWNWNLNLTSSVKEVALPNIKDITISPDFPNPTIVVYNVKENVEYLFISSSVKKESPQKRVRINIFADWPPLLSFPSFELYGDPRPYIDIHVKKGLKELYETKGQGKWEGVTIIDDLTEDSGISDISVDFDKNRIEYYNLNGVKINGGLLTPGMYIKRIGNRTEKIILK